MSQQTPGTLHGNQPQPWQAQPRGGGNPQPYPAPSPTYNAAPQPRRRSWISRSWAPMLLLVAAGLTLAGTLLPYMTAGGTGHRWFDDPKWELGMTVGYLLLTAAGGMTLTSLLAMIFCAGWLRVLGGALGLVAGAGATYAGVDTFLNVTNQAGAGLVFLFVGGILAINASLVVLVQGIIDS